MDIRRFPVALPSLAAAIVLVSVVACGGGGGGSAPTPVATATPTATPTPGSINAAAACSAAVKNPATCVYTITSNPSGIQVTLNGTSIGQTPLSTSPPYAAAAQTLGFANSTYTVPINQTGNAARTVFYNAVMDTSNVAMTGNQSVARAAASVGTRLSANDGGAVRARALEQFDHRPAISTSGVYVKYDASKLTRTIDAIEANAGGMRGADILPSVAAIRGRVVSVRPGGDVRALAGNLLGQPGVIGVYPLHYRVPTSTPITRVLPDDPEFGLSSYQWDMDITQATYAWSLTHGASAKIAIVDTGVDLTHPDLSPKIIYQESDLVSDAGGYITSTAAGAAQDTNGHGTNVAGIAAANTNDGIGFAGVGYGAQILAFRIFPATTSTNDQQTADTGSEALAIAHAVAQGADVINLSLGAAQYDPTSGVGFDQMEHDAVELAIADGVTVVAASGNGDADNVAQAAVDFPAAYDGVISVGAESLLDHNLGSWAPATGFSAGVTESVASYSNYGPGLAVVAPGADDEAGVCTISTCDNLHWIVNDSTQTANDPADQCKPATSPDVCAEKFQGTSQATPHVSGTVALVQSALREHGLATLGPAAMLELIEGTADNIGSPYQGHGRLNTLRAVASAIGVPLVNVPTPPPSTPAQFVAFAYTNSGASGVKPAIADVTYPAGAPVSATGTFRIADIDPSKTTGTFKIAVWLDANGDGIVDAGDQFGASTVTCTATAACNPGPITVGSVTTSPFALP